MPDWIEEIKNEITWISVDGTGWFSGGWFIGGWFSGDASFIEEVKGTINWIEN